MSLENVAKRQAKKMKRALNRQATSVNQQSWQKIKDALHALHTEKLETIIINCFQADDKGVKFSHNLLDFWARQNGFGDSLEKLRQCEAEIVFLEGRIKAITEKYSPRQAEIIIEEDREQLALQKAILNENEITRAFNRIMASMPKAGAFLTWRSKDN